MEAEKESPIFTAEILFLDARLVILPNKEAFDHKVEAVIGGFTDTIMRVGRFLRVCVRVVLPPCLRLLMRPPALTVCVPAKRPCLQSSDRRPLPIQQLNAAPATPALLPVCRGGVHSCLGKSGFQHAGGGGRPGKGLS